MKSVRITALEDIGVDYWKPGSPRTVSERRILYKGESCVFSYSDYEVWLPEQPGQLVEYLAKEGVHYKIEDPEADPEAEMLKKFLHAQYISRNIHRQTKRGKPRRIAWVIKKLLSDSEM